mmetsp:Transcript_5255/g.12545  ORF Transcript_5255/g.12545 Transcript_5255/m.12545 type:complete len:188 (+) Transcript_5255:228-791(+)|eukprot:CAMPEP_0113625890 /NCGR_PEP_ID=MMETSP0017_2-20120614/13378_1 /TAXON_ID=2856 /ORGANISM="Cylindrotheca closterium" /LENGTH=187 /DNA_ID=CAMNT_0000536029 /DNA_START=146 /DNA_END=709 /DNA_ORIENTATION=- /assembly_acc=CAM_ASM_000147
MSSSEPNNTNNTNESSSSSLSSWMEWFAKFQDDQRLERLQTHCKSLDDLFKTCLKNRKSDSDAIEHLGLPLRSIKYFDWRGIAKEYPDVEKTCAREEHLVWSCRAVAIGCGRELAEVKKCFDEEGPLRILSAPGTAYEQGSSSDQNNKKKIPCRQVQEALGNCVNKGAHELYERRRKKQSSSPEGDK